MTESKYQNKIIKDFESRGWFVLKLIKTNKNGIPDLGLFEGWTQTDIHRSESEERCRFKIARI